MLKTCTRCRSRRIRCDARLPACHNCHKSSQPCLIRDEVLQEDIPRSYIKALQDRVSELEALTAVHHSDGDSPRDHPNATLGRGPGLYHYVIPNINTHRFILGSSPPVIVCHHAIQKLIDLGVQIELDHSIPKPTEQPTLRKLPKADKSALSPSIVRSLVAHYRKCIEPVYPLTTNFKENLATSSKGVPVEDCCKTLLACAIAAAHKGYHSPSWRPLAHACREWVDEMLPSLFKRADEDSVVIMTMLSIFELANPERGLIDELLSFAARLCIELGWHNGIDGGSNVASPMTVSRQSFDTDPAMFSSRTTLLSVLASIERPLTILSIRSGVLSNLISSNQSHNDAFQGYQNTILFLMDNVTLPQPPQCPISEHYSSLITALKSMPPDEVMTHEAWLLLLPLLLNHDPCHQCLNTPIMIEEATPSSRGLHSRVLSEASRLICSTHVVVSSLEAFIPPMFATYRAFMAGCVIAIAIKDDWPGASIYFRDLLKCSEVMAFSAPLWGGGREYYDIYRKVISDIL